MSSITTELLKRSGMLPDAYAFRICIMVAGHYHEKITKTTIESPQNFVRVFTSLTVGQSQIVLTELRVIHEGGRAADIYIKFESPTEKLSEEHLITLIIPECNRRLGWKFSLVANGFITAMISIGHERFSERMLDALKNIAFVLTPENKEWLRALRIIREDFYRPTGNMSAVTYPELYFVKEGVLEQRFY